MIPPVALIAPVAATEVGVIAPSVSEIAGVVVEVATVPETPLAVVTETEVTLPEPPPPSAAHVPDWHEYCVPVDTTCWLGKPAEQEPEGAEATEMMLGLLTWAQAGRARNSKSHSFRMSTMIAPQSTHVHSFLCSPGSSPRC